MLSLNHSHANIILWISFLTWVVYNNLQPCKECRIHASFIRMTRKIEPCMFTYTCTHVCGVSVACFIVYISAWSHHLGIHPRGSGLNILHLSVLHLWTLALVILSSCHVKGVVLCTQRYAWSDDWGGGKQFQTLQFVILKIVILKKR